MTNDQLRSLLLAIASSPPLTLIIPTYIRRISLTQAKFNFL
ncbi:MAG: hypothetical protein ACLFWI_22900 [Coleofasciculus sp.]